MVSVAEVDAQSTNLTQGHETKTPYVTMESWLVHGGILSSWLVK